MILQDPFTMLHPMLRCGSIITETLRGEHGKRLGKAQRDAEAVRRLAEVGISDASVAHRYPFELSGGMRQRVAIAAALAQNPRLLIADEPSTALDVTTQQEVLNLLRELQQSRGMALILITHDLRVAFSICQKVTVFYAGSVAETGAVPAVASAPLHPYTLGLLLADPPIEHRVRELANIPGSVPRPDTVASRCAFEARCPWAADECRSVKPTLLAVGGARSVACVRHPHLNDAMAEWRTGFTITAASVPPTEPDTAPALVAVRDLQVTFPRRPRGTPVHALKGVSVTVSPGESVGIVGESGSGKTTLGRSLVGLVQPTAGTITVGGIDATSYARASRDDLASLRRLIQIVFQDPYSSLNPSRTIGATLAEALSVRLGRKPDAGEAKALLTEVGLPEAYAGRRPSALSGGERQRVAIARAIAVRPKLLVCDEPVSALDVSAQAQILTLLRSIRDELGIALLFVTHDLAVVRQIADRVYVMRRGEVVESGPTGQVLDRPQHSYTKRLIDSIPRAGAAS
jgi:peptide/nickel transport system ATP-binding protein